MSNFISQLEECIPPLRRYANSLFYNQDEADDLVQDCLERALRKQSLWKPSSSLRSWLFTMQHNLYVNKLRSKGRKPEMIAETDTLSHRQEPYKHDALIHNIDFCIKQLPEDHREVLILVTVEGFAYKEVAQILDIPVGTVMSRLSRARKDLQGIMTGETKPVLRRVK